MGARSTGSLLLAAVLVLSACGGEGVPQLMNLRKQSASPDEFSILPTQPLTQPDDYAALPAPTPGGTNRADRDPGAEAVAALGGRPGAGGTGDQGLMSRITRFGVSQSIRQVTAAEDLEFRRDNNGRLLERAFNVNVYFKAYRDRNQTLDRYRELERLRRAGVRTPAAPPETPQE